MKIFCPFHPDEHPSMELYDDLHAHCFACGAHVELPTLMEISGYQPFQDLDRFFSTHLGLLKYRSSEERGVIRPREEWSSDPAKMDYLAKRGYSSSSLEHWQTKTWKGVLFAWPIDGDKWLTRWHDGKYIGDTGAKKGLVRCSCSPSGDLILVEGILDAMKVHQAGFRNVAATCGIPTNKQISGLKKRAGKLYMMADMDAGGDAQYNRLVESGLNVIRVVYTAEDPGAATEEEIREALGRAGYKTLEVEDGVPF